MRVSIESYLKYNAAIPIHIIECGSKEEVLAKRPEAILSLLNSGYDQVLHLGADMMFYGNIEDIFNDCSNADVAATPHLLTDTTDAERYAWTRLTGIYNSDFTLWNNAPCTIKFLEWQHKMLQQANLSQPNHGYFYDQGYLDMLPVLTNFVIIENPAINMAYYNLFERQGIKPIAFQFTGWSPRYPYDLSQYMKESDKIYLTPEIVCLIVDYFRRLIQ